MPDPTPQDLRREAARLLGQVTNEKKAAAARRNGRKGGRPRGTPQSPETRAKISARWRTRQPVDGREAAP